MDKKINIDPTWSKRKKVFVIIKELGKQYIKSKFEPKY